MINPEPIDPDDEEAILEGVRSARYHLMAIDLIAAGRGPETIANGMELFATLAESLGAMAMVLERLGDNPEIVKGTVAQLKEIVDTLKKNAVPPDIDNPESV